MVQGRAGQLSGSHDQQLAEASASMVRISQRPREIGPGLQKVGRMAEKPVEIGNFAAPPNDPLEEGPRRSVQLVIPDEREPGHCLRPGLFRLPRL